MYWILDEHKILQNANHLLNYVLHIYTVVLTWDSRVDTFVLETHSTEGDAVQKPSRCGSCVDHDLLLYEATLSDNEGSITQRVAKLPNGKIARICHL